MNRVRLLTFALPLALATAGGLGVAACLDMTAYYVPPPPDAAPPVFHLDSGAPDAPDVVDTRPPCERCIESPDDAGGCATELTTCLADTVCNEIYACVVSSGCLEKPNQRQAIICGLPCAQNAGVFDPNDPSAQLAIAVVNCGETTCAGICLPEGGAPIDAGQD